MAADHSQQELYDAVREAIVERVPFNQLLDLRLSHFDAGYASFRLNMRPELIGNHKRGILHGGVIASALDVTGGLVAFLGAIGNEADATLADKISRFDRLGTIDLRIDFLRPGAGKFFVANGYLLRSGSRVAVTRMELHDEKDSLIAVGTGAYIVA